MVIDNADNQDVFFPQELEMTHQTTAAHNLIAPLSRYLPQTSKSGLILITSRTREAAYYLTNSDERIIQVPFMNKADATALLCRKMEGMCDPTDRSNDIEKADLVERLDCLPLAITQATSYIIVRKRTMTIPKYSKILEKNEEILLARVPDNRRDPSYPNSVLLTLQISFDQIGQDSKPATELLSLMSLFDRQGIPRILLREEEDDDLDFEKRLDPLIAFSLITSDENNESFQLHRLVQVAVQSWLKRDRTLYRFKQQALKVIASNLPASPWRFWDIWESLLPHANTTLGYANPDPKMQLLHAKISDNIARYYSVHRKHDLSVELCKRAFDIYLDLLGEADDRTAHALVSLGREERRHARSVIQAISGRHESMLRKMMKTFHGRAVEKHLRRELASSLLHSGDDEKIDEAITLLESLINLQRDTRHIVRDFAMGNLAAAYMKRGRLAEAADIEQEALNARLRIFPENDPRISFSLDRLAEVMMELNRTKEAYDFGKGSLDFRIRVYGKEHLRTLHAVRRLAHIWSKWSVIDETKREEAYQFCRNAMNLHSRVFGKEHEMTTVCTVVLTGILEDQGKYDEAEGLSRHLILLRTNALGEENERTIHRIRQLVRILGAQNKYIEAEDSQRHVIVLDTAVHGLKARQTTEDMMDLAGILYNQGKYAKAEEVYRELLNMDLAEWSSRRKDRFYRRFARTLRALGKHEQVKEIEI